MTESGVAVGNLWLLEQVSTAGSAIAFSHRFLSIVVKHSSLDCGCELEGCVTGVTLTAQNRSTADPPP